VNDAKDEDMGDKAGRWLRVSTSGQSEDSQEPDIDRHITGQGYETARTYRLHGKSASKGEQEETLAQVIRDIEAGDVTVLVAWSLDRLDRRGIAESFMTKFRIEQAGGRVEFVREPSMSDLEFAVKAYMASEESKRKMERSQIGLDAARGNRAAIGKPSWGYRTAGPKREKRFEPTAEGRKLVPVIFQRIADGDSLGQVERWLMTQHTSRKVWHGRVIGRLIRNSVYMGLARDASGAVTHECEPLVDAALWQRANDVLDGSKHRKHGPNGSKSLLAGVLLCGSCGAVMYRTPPDKRRPHRYYRCTASHGVTVGCQEIETWVDQQMSRNAGFVTREVLVPGKSYAAEIARAEFRLRELGKQGLDWDAEDAERARLRAEIKRLRDLPAEPDRIEEDVLPITVGDAWQMLRDVDERRAFLHAAEITVRAVRGDFRIEGDPARLGTDSALWRIIDDLDYPG
jgi:DNA invertase Pin-like site-specific DNA recombinase